MSIAVRPAESLQSVDPEVFSLIERDRERHNRTLNFIASENYASPAVLECLASHLNVKYAEGYPRARYYQGVAIVDDIEQIAIERAKNLFGAEHANVQPYSGSPANLAVYFALLKPGDKIMGMGLPHGGHLSHGWNISITGQFWKAVQYPVDRESRRLDYDAIREMARRERPRMIVAGATAYPRQIDFSIFGAIAREVGAFLLADIAHIAGLIIAGVHPDPVPHADVITTTAHKTLRGPRGAMILCRKEVADRIDRAVFPGLQGGPHNQTTAAIGVALKEASTPAFKEYGRQIVRNAAAMADELMRRGFDLVSGGTDNHLILIDLTNKNVPGKKAAKALERAGIVCNYNTVPYDTRKPFNPSGIRLGTPAVTSRGMGEEQMRQVAAWMDQVIRHVDDEAAIARVGEEVRAMCRDFTAPGILQGD